MKITLSRLAGNPRSPPDQNQSILTTEFVEAALHRAIPGERCLDTTILNHFSARDSCEESCTSASPPTPVPVWSDKVCHRTIARRREANTSSRTSRTTKPQIRTSTSTTITTTALTAVFIGRLIAIVCSILINNPELARPAY